MARLIALDGSEGEGGAQILRTALALSAVSGQGFELSKIRERRARPGLRPQHVAAARAAALACEARVSGVFEGSPDLRFEPGPLAAGEFRFEIPTAGAATLVLQTVLAPLALTQGASNVAVTGGTHVPKSPSAEFLSRHWCAAVARLGLQAGIAVEKVGFHPRGGGELVARVSPWARPSAPLQLEERGALLGVSIVSGAAHLRGEVAERQAEAARARLWEERRIEAQIEVVRPETAGPGSYLSVFAVFEHGHAGFGQLGEKGLRAERLGDRAARRLLKWLDGPGAVDPLLADQLALPMALSGAGGKVRTSEVTSHLETVAAVLRRFDVPAVVEGRRGEPGMLEIGAFALGVGHG